MKIIKIVGHRPDPARHPELAAEFERDHQLCIKSGHVKEDDSGFCAWCGDALEEKNDVPNPP